MNHPFLDGNKRIGALALLTMLDLNQIELQIDSEELEQIILLLAAGELSEEALVERVQEHIGAM